MTTATLTASQIDNDLQALEEYINNCDGYELRDEIYAFCQEEYEPQVDLLYSLISEDFTLECEAYDEKPTDEQVKRLYAIHALFTLKVAPVFLEQGLNWVEDMPEGEAKQACLKQIQDFLTEQTTTTNN
jgi:hypothetical protein